MRAGKPVVCADTSPPDSIAAYAEQVGAHLSQVKRDFDYVAQGESWSWWNTEQRFADQPLPQLPLPSMAAALQVASLLKLDLTGIAAFSCLAQLRVPGRFQRIHWQDRDVILDVAHNPAATAYLVSRLQESQLLPRPIHAVVAMMSDKDRAESLANLAGVVNHWYLADLTYIPRAASTTQVQQTLADMNCPVDFAGSVAECVSAAHQASKAGDIILIFGSFFTVAEGLQAVACSE
jgi:dihydrofolate synthase/folylpolyglutamate synthase